MLFTALLCLLTQLPQPDGGGLQPGSFPPKWISGGPSCIEEPDWQVHEYNADLFIIRQSGCTHYEKPFLYLIFGQEKVVLIDTGAGKNDVARIVDSTIAKWLKRKNRVSIKLLVVHSHGHGDHTAGDAQFKERPDTELVAANLDAIQKAFNITDWPNTPGKLDLGGRTLDALPIPGHHTVDLAYYDAATGLVFSGDSLYPGRLYVSNWAEYEKSITRLVKFLDGKPVAHILGAHVEQAVTPYLDYPVRTSFQPKEHALELSRATLLELQKGLAALDGKATRVAYRDFTIWPNIRN